MPQVIAKDEKITIISNIFDDGGVFESLLKNITTYNKDKNSFQHYSDIINDYRYDFKLLNEKEKRTLDYINLKVNGYKYYEKEFYLQLVKEKEL